MVNGVDVYLVDLPNDKDPAELGFETIQKLINDTILLSSDKLMEQKILCSL